MGKTISIELLKEEDIVEINRLFNLHNKANRTREQFEWEFLYAPAGKSIYTVARDVDTKKIVGIQCAVPFYLRNNKGEMILTAKSEDTLVDPEYRGLNIFENMYDKLFEECTKAGINYIWGFTYAKKPFIRIGFSIPYNAIQGLASTNIFRTYNYLKSLNPKNKAKDKFKIFGLSVLSFFNSIQKSFIGSSHDGYKIVKENRNELNSLLSDFTKENENYYFLSEDKEYMNWRLDKNPYQNKLIQFSLIDNNNNKTIGSIIFDINDKGIGYISQIVFHSEISLETKKKFLNYGIKEIKKSEVFIIRYWGFEINEINKDEINLLKSVGFTFINRGISFVWKNQLSQDPIKPENLILSRMFSQGNI